MKRTKKTITAILLILTLICTTMLTGCSEMSSAADVTVKDFTDAIANEDYEKALSLMHPSYRSDVNKLSDSIANVEQTLGIDFSNGVEFESTVGMHVYFGLNFPLGPLTETTMTYYITVGSVKIEMQAAVVNSFGGSGISAFICKNRTVTVV
ncbi:MAG: hypothetical protein IKC87_03310 [Clostridia bacterium]|nr:hypothetical protein [Clostridia bacterium]